MKNYVKILGLLGLFFVPSIYASTGLRRMSGSGARIAASVAQNDFVKSIGNGELDSVIRQLASGQVSVHLPASNGYFPLHVAASIRQPALLEFLLDKGASVDAALPRGKTALMCAAESGDYNAVILLLKAGAAPKAKIICGNPFELGTVACNSCAHCKTLGWAATDFARAAGCFDVVDLLEKC